MKNNNLDQPLHLTKEMAISEWEICNDLLYQFCEKYPYHNDNVVIANKVVVIGRVYAASVERRKIRDKDKKELSSDFLLDKIANAILISNIDSSIKELKLQKDLTEANLPLVLELHKKLMNCVREITDYGNRSFCSKYLHFHLPNHFYIYDSRAKKALNEILKRLDKVTVNKYVTSKEIDYDYASFFNKMRYIQLALKSEYQVDFTPRQLDTILLKIADGKI